MKEIRASGNESYLVGFVETWFFNGEWDGIKIFSNEKVEYADFIGQVQGISLGQIGFYGIVAEDKMFELSSYLFHGAVITLGKKRSLEGQLQLSEQVPSRIVHIIGREKTKIESIAKMLDLPLK